MVGFLGTGLIIAAGVVSGQFTQFWNVITNAANTGPVISGSTSGVNVNKSVGAAPVNRDQILLLGGEVIFVIIAAKLAETSDAANKVLTALLVSLWFVWAMYNSKTLTDWVNKVQPKPGG